MSFEIGTTVEVLQAVFLGRWIQPLERGMIIGTHCSPAGQEVYDVRLEDGIVYVFGLGEIKWVWS